MPCNRARRALRAPSERNRKALTMNDKETVTDNGNNVVIANASPDADNRHIANAKAAAIVKAILLSETALAVTAKDWGSALFRSVHNDKVSLDTLIGESKLSAGFATLGASEAGKKAKQRMEVYFSNARLVNEGFSTMTDEAQAAILNGESSIHYIAGQIRDANRKALAAAKKAEAAGEAAADASAAVTTDEAETLLQRVDALRNAWAAATDDERSTAYDSVSALFDEVNASIEAATSGEGETVEVKAA